MNEKTMEIAGLIPLDVNVELVHLDADGNVKPIFQENKTRAIIIFHIGFRSA